MQLISTKICKTSDIGINDNLFGGMMLQWIDEAAGAMAASTCCTPNMITLKMEEVVFKKPVKVNQHIRIYGEVNQIGRTSISLTMEARRFDFEEHDESVVCSTKMLFVKIDNNGKASPINPEICEKIRKQKKLK
jgi:acyl-CoA thioesterase YciA